MLITSRPTSRLLRYTRAHMPGQVPAVVPDPTTPAAVQRICCVLLRIEAARPGTLTALDELLGEVAAQLARGSN